MKKCFITALLIMVVGCTERPIQKPDFAGTIYPVGDSWKAKYGDSETSQLYYNLVLCEKLIDNHAKVINNQAAVLNKLSADVNSLSALFAEPNEPNEAL